jgi:hypothetical protein
MRSDLQEVVSSIVQEKLLPRCPEVLSFLVLFYLTPCISQG